jgi:hypothetical protein
VCVCVCACSVGGSLGCSVGPVGWGVLSGSSVALVGSLRVPCSFGGGGVQLHSIGLGRSLRGVCLVAG